MLNLNSDPFRYIGAVVKIDKNIGTGKFSRSPVLERRKTRTFLYLLFDLSLTKTRFLFGFDFLLLGWVIFTQSFTLRTRGSDERKSIFSTRIVFDSFVFFFF